MAQETEMAEERYVSYRWVMLALVWVIGVCQSWVRIIPSPLAKPLMADLNMDHGMLMAALGAPMMVSIFLAIPGGILADKFGMKRMIIIGGIISGISGILRGYSTTYLQFFVFGIVSGFGSAIMMPNLAKLVREWFPPHQIAIASGIYIVAGTTGMTLGFGATYPIFGFNWRLAFYSISGFLLLGIVIWFFLAKERRREAERRTIIQNLLQAARYSNVWMTAFFMFFRVGGIQIFTRLLPIALQTARSVSLTTAGAIASVNTIGAVTGGLLGPFISDRIGRRKPFLIVCPVLGAILIYLMWNLPFGPSTWVFSFLMGLVVASTTPIISAVIIEQPGMPAEILGTAVGLRTAVSSSGSYLIGVLGGYIVDWTSGYDIPFLVAAIVVLVSVIFGALVTETGPKARARVNP